MKRLLALVLVVLSACGGWIAYSPASRIPFDSRLGAQVMAGDPLIAMQVNAGAVGPSKLLVNVTQALGRKTDLTTIQQPRTEVYELDTPSGMVRKLPDPPINPKRPAVFATTWSPTVTVLRDDDETFALWDGASWRVLPLPPGGTGNGIMLVADERHVIVDRGDAFAAFDGTSWVSAPRRGQLGPVDANGVRLIFPDVRGLCTELLSWTTLQPQGAASCTANASGGATEPALNGRVDDFQVVADGAVFHFANGAWQRGVAVPSTSALVAAPGSLSVPLRNQLAAQLPSHLILRGGAVVGLLTPQLEMKLDCACNRGTDPSCGCVPLAPIPQWAFVNDGSALIALTINTVDAKRAVFARTLELPLSESPWGPVCAKSCPTGERCEIVIGTSGFASDVCVSNDPMSNVPRAQLIANVRSANPGTVNISLAAPDGGTLDARVVTGAPSLVIEGPPLADVNITLTQEGHAPRLLAVRFPDASRTGDLGAVPLLGARFLTTEPVESAQGWSVPVTSAAALLVPRAAPDSGVIWTALRTDTDGGLASTPLATGQTQFVAPLWLPRQHRVLVFGPTSLAAFDDVTLEPRGTFAGVFTTEPSASSLGDVAFVSGTHLLRFGSQDVTSLASVTGTSTLALLSADGGVGLRSVGTSWQAVFSDGTTRQLPNLVSTNPTLEASGRAVFFARNDQLMEVDLATGAARVVAPGANSLAAGLRSDRLVASGSVQDGGVFTPFCDLYASGTRQGPFVDGLFGRSVPGGAWVSSENTDLVVRTVDDGVSRETLSGVNWRFVPLTDEGFAAVPGDQTQATEVRYFVEGRRVATLAKVTAGAPFGAGDGRLLSARRLYRYAPSTGATSDEWRIIDDETPFTVDPTFVSLASAPAFSTKPVGSSRGMPCALFTTPHLTWSVANDGTVTRREEGVDVFCAQ